MRLPPWMQMNDLIILRFMEDGRVHTPKHIHRNLCEYGEYDYSERTIRRRLHKLLENGYIERLDESAGTYRIIQKGYDFLENA